jgi:hypothetical protein
MSIERDCVWLGVCYTRVRSVAEGAASSAVRCAVLGRTHALPAPSTVSQKRPHLCAAANSAMKSASCCTPSSGMLL